MRRASSEPQLPSSNTHPGPATHRVSGIRRRIRATAGGSAGGLDVGRNMLRFYTDDAAGVKVSPTAVLVMTLFFIGFVTALHLFGKLYRKSFAYYPDTKTD